MSRQNISIGTTANDGSGDTLRTAGGKINDNFVEIYRHLANDSDTLSSNIFFEDSSIVFEGASADAYETRLHVVNPTADRSIQLPNESGIITLNAATQTLTNKTLTSPSLTTPSVTTSINDANSNEIIKFTATGSAVNEITVVNAATGNNPQINATGTDTNVNLNLNAKGTGSVEISKAAFESVALNTDTAVPTNATFITCYRTVAGNLIATLADGTTVGEYKIFVNQRTATYDVQVTPSNMAGGTKFTIDPNGSATVVWDGSNWYVTGGTDVTIT